jgi:hypothetical protein
VIDHRTHQRRHLQTEAGVEAEAGAQAHDTKLTHDKARKKDNPNTAHVPPMRREWQLASRTTDTFKPSYVASRLLRASQPINSAAPRPFSNTVNQGISTWEWARPDHHPTRRIPSAQCPVPSAQPPVTHRCSRWGQCPRGLQNAGPPRHSPASFSGCRRWQNRT